MRIAVIDVAAESGGAMSVLRDFLSYVVREKDDQNEYYVFVSKELDIVNSHVHYILKPEIKKSWINRLRWERMSAIRELEKMRIDAVFSLQNTAFYSRKLRQIVYFHNVLLLESSKKYSLWKKEERLYGFYTRFIAPYTLHSLKNANTIICQTNTVKEMIMQRVSGKRVVVVYPNVNVEDDRFDTSMRPIRGYIYPTSAVPFKHIEEVVACVKENADWFYQKGLEVLITIDGKENQYAQTICKMGEKIACLKFIGYQKREKILDLYQNHALIINSELESFPLPFREAELIGTPIVAADYPYAEEILNNNDDASTFIKHDLNDMFSKMRLAFENTKHRQTIRIERHNTWAEVMKEIIG